MILRHVIFEQRFEKDEYHRFEGEICIIFFSRNLEIIVALI